MKKLTILLLLLPAVIAARKNELSLAPGVHYIKQVGKGFGSPSISLKYTYTISNHLQLGVGIEAFKLFPAFNFYDNVFGAPGNLQTRAFLTNDNASALLLPLVFVDYKLTRRKHTWCFGAAASYLSTKNNKDLFIRSINGAVVVGQETKATGPIAGLNIGYNRIISREFSVGLHISPRLAFMHYSVDQPAFAPENPNTSVLIMPVQLLVGYHF